MPTDRIQRRVDRLLDQAEAAADQDDWRLVDERAKMVLAVDPENEDALSLLAMVEQHGGVGEGAAVDDALRDPAEPPPPASTPPAPTTPADDDRAVPVSFVGGRYEVLRLLGEGGKKLVYLAHDTLLDRDVAFGLIKAEGLDEASMQRVTREAQAIGRIGEHPSIMPIYDMGMEGKQPYMIQPVMGGGDVEDLIQNAPENRLSNDKTLEIGLAVAEGLVFAHSNGIVHRDLKPGNVWLSDDGQVKIGDYGLALSSGRSRLTREGMMVGTVAYMPPEQATGGAVTERSDLYSLGAMLYEMVTGRTPFIGDDEFAIIGQHINTPPVSPSWHCSTCPRALDSLIMRMLAKNPEERPESAAVVLEALEQIDPADVGVAESSDTGGFQEGSGDAFIGRHRELEMLKARFEDAITTNGRVTAIVGEPGIGKTRLIQELIPHVEMRGGQVLWGRCYESQGAPPHWPWVQAIRSYVRDKDPSELREEMGAGASAISEIISDIRERFPDVPTVPDVGDPDAARFRLFDSIATFLKNAARRRPMVIVLDDLHWADRPSLQLLEFVSRELLASNILLIGIYRDVDISRAHPLSQTLGELIRDSRFERISLTELSRSEVAEFVEIVGGMEPPSVLVEMIFNQTEGNPLFVTEVIRLLIQDGQLTPANRNRTNWNVAIPQGVREIVGRQLDRLSEECAAVLTTAAVIGREFTLFQLDRLLEDLSEDQILDVLEQALEMSLIEESPGTVGHYTFAHALTRHTLTDEMSLTRRVRLHARIATMLEELYGPEAEQHAEQLAYHFDMARTVHGTDQLVKYSAVAGNEAHRESDFRLALSHFEKASEAAGSQTDPALLAEVQAGLGLAQIATLERHRTQRGIDTLREAFETYVRIGSADRAVALAENPIPSIAGVTRASDLFSRALELAPAGTLQAGRLHSQLGNALATESADYDGAQAAFEAALEIARKISDSSLEISTLISAADVDVQHIDYLSAKEKGAQAIESATRIHFSEAEMQARVRTVIASLRLGQPSGVEEHLAAMDSLARRSADPQSMEAVFLTMQGYQFVMGDWAGAKESNTRLLELIPGNAIAIGERALLEAHEGNIDSCESYLTRLLNAMSMTAPGPSLWHAIPALVIPLIGRLTGNYDRHAIAEEAAASVLESRAASPERQLFARAGIAISAVADDNHAEAETAYESLLERRKSPFMIALLVSVDHLLGLLAITRGDQAGATSHFDDAAAFCRDAGYRPELAWTCVDYSNLLENLDAEANAAQIVELQDEAIDIARSLGMRPLLEQVIAHREILKA